MIFILLFTFEEPVIFPPKALVASLRPNPANSNALESEEDGTALVGTLSNLVFTN